MKNTYHVILMILAILFFATFSFAATDESGSPFGSGGAGSGVLSKEFTVTNTGGGLLSVTGADITGTNPDEFEIIGDTCSGSTQMGTTVNLSANRARSSGGKRASRCSRSSSVTVRRASKVRHISAS